MTMKWFAIGIILLFVGITIAPAINFNTVIASKEEEFIELTTQACGIKGYKDTTVKLTREQYNELEQYLVEFRARLNQTSTREKAIPIFKDAVVELDKYGLLPKGMSVEKAQHSIIHSAHISLTSVLMEKIGNPVCFSSDNYSNLFCLIAGVTDNTSFENPASIFFYVASHLNINLYLMFLFYSLYSRITGYSRFNPLGILNRINFGGYDEYNSREYPASGWLTTIGLSGLTSNQGNIRGALPIEGTHYSAGPFPGKRRYPGVIGFIGIKIGLGSLIDYYTSYFEATYLYIGSALWIEVSTDTPESQYMRLLEKGNMIT